MTHAVTNDVVVDAALCVQVRHNRGIGASQRIVDHFQLVHARASRLGERDLKRPITGHLNGDSGNAIQRRLDILSHRRRIGTIGNGPGQFARVAAHTQLEVAAGGVFNQKSLNLLHSHNHHSRQIPMHCHIYLSTIRDYCIRQRHTSTFHDSHR